MAEPQPELQAWLEKDQGLTRTDADQHARRLVAVFGGDQQAALASLPTTFAWCTSRGLSGLQTAQLLGRIAKKRRDSVVSFAATAQRDWQLIEPYIAVHVQRLRQAEKQLPKHASLAALVCGRGGAAMMLATPPGHVASWLAAVGKQLPDAADVGRLVIGSPFILAANPQTTLAALRWCVEALSVQPAQLAAYAAKVAALLKRDTASLQANLAALQRTLGAELTLQLAQKHPVLLGNSSVTVQQTLEWLQRQFGGDAARLQAVLERGSRLLSTSAEALQRRADYLQRQLGWQPGDCQLAAFIEKYPQPFATVSFDSPDKQVQLLLLTSVLGVSLADLLSQWSSHLMYSLPTVTARYILVQVRLCPGGLLHLDAACNALPAA